MFLFSLMSDDDIEKLGELYKKKKSHLSFIHKSFASLPAMG